MKVQLQIVNKPAKTWTEIKKISGLPHCKATTAKSNPFTPDDLNMKSLCLMYLIWSKHQQCTSIGNLY